MALPPSQAVLYTPVQLQLSEQGQTHSETQQMSPSERLTVFWHSILVDRSSMLHDILFFTFGWHLQKAVELCRSGQECAAGGRTSRETLQTVSVRLFLISRTHEYFLFAADETPARVLSISHSGDRSFISAALPVHMMAVPAPSTHVMFLPNAHTSELLLLTWVWWPSTPGISVELKVFCSCSSSCSIAHGAASPSQIQQPWLHRNSTTFGISPATANTPHTSADFSSCHWWAAHRYNSSKCPTAVLHLPGEGTENAI